MKKKYLIISYIWNTGQLPNSTFIGLAILWISVDAALLVAISV